MNIFTNFANNITQGVNKIESNINDTLDIFNEDINITVDNVSRDLNLNSEEEYQAILADLRNNRPATGINPEDIKDMTDEQALNFIRSRGVTNFLEETSEGPPVPAGSPPPEEDLPVEDLPERTPEVVESIQEEEAQEILQDPQIAGIFNDLRTEFPEPTPTPNVRLEGFEDVPLTTAVRVNKHLKQQFMENFKF